MSEAGWEDAELVVEPSSAERASDDPRFSSDIDELQELLKTEVGNVEVRNGDVPGQRGGLVEIIAVLGSSGAIAAAVTAFKSWLDRDRARRVKVRVRRKASKGRSALDVEVEVDAANVEGTVKVLRQAMR